MFESLSPAPPDPILGLTEAYKKDPRPEKVNLGVGVYQNDNGETPILRAVKAAETALLEIENTKNYLPIPGDPEFGRCVESFLFGERSVATARTAQAVGGTGALRVIGQFLAEAAPNATVWISTPTWPNHRGIFGAAGLKIQSYPYYDARARALDFPAFAEALDHVPAGDVVLLHLDCHNPTGADPTLDQWQQIAEIAGRRGWIPLFDAAYIGLGDSVEQDRTPLGVFLGAGLELLIATSFAKNIMLYGERAGALTLVARSAAAAEAAFSRIKRVIRTLYSSPPIHAGRIVQMVFSDAILRAMWRDELREMCGRIRDMRSRLAEGLAARLPDRDFSHIRAQRGMFSYSGLSAAQAGWLRAERAIYMTDDGRINVAGVTTRTLNYVCDAIAEAVRTVRDG